LNKADILRTIRGERRRTLGFLQTLDPAMFDTPTALPGWRIREIVAHLIATDRASVTGAILPAVVRGVPALEAWNEKQVPKWAGRSVPELLGALDRWGRRFARLVGAIPGPLYRMRLSNPWGPTAGLILWVRAYDEWIHRQDIRRALEMPDDQVDLDEIAEFFLITSGHMTIKRLGGQQGTILLSLSGAAVPEWTIDLAGRASGPVTPGTNPDEGHLARIVASASAFMMAAAGRDRFQDLQAKDALHVDGDEKLADEFLSGLLVV
jgi:uncharacterized protein (TIGR03083 family)